MSIGYRSGANIQAKYSVRHNLFTFKKGTFVLHTMHSPWRLQLSVKEFDKTTV